MNLMTSKITRDREDFSYILEAHNQMQHWFIFFVILNIYVCPIAVVNFLCLKRIGREGFGNTVIVCFQQLHFCDLMCLPSLTAGYYVESANNSYITNRTT